MSASEITPRQRYETAIDRLAEVFLSGFETLIERTRDPTLTETLGLAQPHYADKYQFGNFTIRLDSDVSPSEQPVVTDIAYQRPHTQRPILFVEDRHPVTYAETDTPSQYTDMVRAYMDIWDEEIGGRPDAHTALNENLSIIDTVVQSHPQALMDPSTSSGDDDSTDSDKHVSPELTAESIESMSMEEVVEILEEYVSQGIEPQADFESDDAPDLSRLLSPQNGRIPNRLITHYTDDHLALLSHPGSRTAYVIGFDDTPSGLFIHELSGVSPPETTTRDAIRHAMGFHHDLDHDDLDEPVELNRTTRVQGDLALTLPYNYTGPEQAATALARAQQVRLDLERTYGARNTEVLLDATRVYVDSQMEKIRTNIYHSYVNRAQDIFQREFDDPAEDGEVSVNRGMSDELTQRCAHLFERTGDITAADIDGQAQGLTLPIDNHLLRFEAAVEYPLSVSGSEPVLVIVPHESTLSITHEEHPEKRISLDPGLYECGLLHRGGRPEGFLGPEW